MHVMMEEMVDGPWGVWSMESLGLRNCLNGGAHPTHFFSVIGWNKKKNRLKEGDRACDLTAFVSPPKQIYNTITSLLTSRKLSFSTNLSSSSSSNSIYSHKFLLHAYNVRRFYRTWGSGWSASWPGKSFQQQGTSIPFFFLRGAGAGLWFLPQLQKLSFFG